MPGCLYKCAEIGNGDYEDIWTDVRNHYGPLPESLSQELRNDQVESDYDRLLNEDLTDYYEWLGEHPEHTDSSRLFGRHLNWKLSIGTNNYGNLSTRKRDHTGISCIPCPYDTDSSAERSEYWLGEPVGTQVDHGEHYMRVANRGRVWGFECTYSGCPYEVANGRSYFYA